MAKRKFTEVTPNWRRELKIVEVLPKLVHLQKLGYFHSHTRFRSERSLPELSKEDRKYMQEGEIEIIVAINDAEKNIPLSRIQKETFWRPRKLPH